MLLFQLFFESSHLEFGLIQLIVQSHCLLLVLTQLFLQVTHLTVSCFDVLLAASALKLETADELFALLLGFH